MSWRWTEAAAAAFLLAAAPLEGQQIKELGLQVIGTASDPAAAVAGGYGALRVSRRFRISLGIGAGISDGETAGRGELLAHFLLSPRTRRGLAAYAAGGVAAVVGPLDEGYLVLALGLESRPGATSGWFLEAGIGGGARLAGGYRWRWFPRWWSLTEP
jgi:hypothetical protein